MTFINKRHLWENEHCLLNRIILQLNFWKFTSPRINDFEKTKLGWKSGTKKNSLRTVLAKSIQSRLFSWCFDFQPDLPVIAVTQSCPSFLFTFPLASSNIIPGMRCRVLCCCCCCTRLNWCLICIITLPQRASCKQQTKKVTHALIPMACLLCLVLLIVEMWTVFQLALGNCTNIHKTYFTDRWSILNCKVEKGLGWSHSSSKCNLLVSILTSQDCLSFSRGVGHGTTVCSILAATFNKVSLSQYFLLCVTHIHHIK